MALTELTNTADAPEKITHLFGWSPQTWSNLDQISIIFGNMAPLIATLAALWGFSKRDQVRAFFTRNKFQHTGGEVDDEACWPSLIFTIPMAL